MFMFNHLLLCVDLDDSDIKNKITFSHSNLLISFLGHRKT
jgi:hypothetical protein